MEKLTSRSNPVCVHVKKLGRSKSYREEHGEFLCDGKTLLNEAVQNGADIKIVLTSRDLKVKLPQNTRVYHVREDLIDSLSPLKNSLGLLFTCSFISNDDCDYHKGTHVLLDRVQDPGNVGTIIRNAHAFGVESVMLVEGSADIYNPKTIRASMGAIFKQRICNKTQDKIIELKQSGVKFIGTSNDSDSVDIKQADLRNAVIVLGNEGQGISDSLRKLCEEMVKIPLSSDCESLNVAIAAAIVMWESIR